VDTATTIVTSLLSVFFLTAGGTKLAGAGPSVEMRDHLGIPPRQRVGIGALEVAGAGGAAVGLALRPLGIAAATGLVFLSVGAIATHLRAEDPVVDALPAAVALALASAAVVLQAVTT
jgi:hypothetical protein